MHTSIIPSPLSLSQPYTTLNVPVELKSNTCGQVMLFSMQTVASVSVLFTHFQHEGSCGIQPFTKTWQCQVANMVPNVHSVPQRKWHQSHTPSHCGIFLAAAGEHLWHSYYNCGVNKIRTKQSSNKITKKISILWRQLTGSGSRSVVILVTLGITFSGWLCTCKTFVTLGSRLSAPFHITSLY